MGSYVQTVRLYANARRAVPLDRRRLIGCEVPPLDMAYTVACRYEMSGAPERVRTYSYDGSLRLLRDLAGVVFDVEVLCSEKVRP